MCEPLAAGEMLACCIDIGLITSDSAVSMVGDVDVLRAGNRVALVLQDLVGLGEGRPGPDDMTWWDRLLRVPNDDQAQQRVLNYLLHGLVPKL